MPLLIAAVTKRANILSEIKKRKTATSYPAVCKIIIRLAPEHILCAVLGIGQESSAFYLDISFYPLILT